MQKIQFYIIMSNWVGQLKNWLDSFVPVRQFCSVRLHNWRYVVRLKTLQTEAVMPKNHAQGASCTELQLLEISQIIGSIVESNRPFTLGLAHAIDTHSTPLCNISLSDFIQLIKEYQTTFNLCTEASMEGIS